MTPNEPVLGRGQTDRFLTPDEIEDVVVRGIDAMRPVGKRILAIVPDGTRTMPLAEMTALLDKHLRPRAARLDYLIALGTHMPMTDEQLSRHFGRQVRDGRMGTSRIYNHLWSDPASFTDLGSLSAGEIERLSAGRLALAVPVRLNKLVLQYDQLLVVGPVFPHEVVGFSGGTKYFFPGIAGPEIINLTHWLGALMTNMAVIGAGYTPVRAVIDRAADLIPTPAFCFALVVEHGGTAGIYFDTPQRAWHPAAALSAQKHIHYIEKPFQKILAVMPRLYDDLWTGGKGMYKAEPALANGGEVIIYAPHIDEVSYTHGKILEEVGYHTRDYFTTQWERFMHFPWGVLAHSTHVKGQGAYDPASGVETPRVTVTVASAIPAERIRRINLSYLDPRQVNPQDWAGREHEGILLIPRAGEMLYRLKP
jgi:nickel-dependent lactate racemase